jgi:hypothetical protein
MGFDISAVVTDMIGAVKTTVKDKWPEVKDTANTFLLDRKDRLELLASLRLQNEISEEFFVKRLADEKNILESELRAITVLTKAIAQKAANAAITVLNNAISKFITI